MVNTISAAAVRHWPASRQQTVRPRSIPAEPQFSGIAGKVFERFPMTSILGTCALLSAGLVGLFYTPPHTFKNQSSTSVVTATLNTAAEKTAAVEAKQVPDTAEFMAKFKQEYETQKKDWRFENYMAFKQPKNMTQSQYQFTQESIRYLNWCTEHRPSGVSSADSAIKEVNLWIDQVAKPHVGDQTAAALKTFARQEIKEGKYTASEKAQLRAQGLKAGGIIAAVIAAIGLGIDGLAFEAFSFGKKSDDDYS